MGIFVGFTICMIQLFFILMIYDKLWPYNSWFYYNVDLNCSWSFVKQMSLNHNFEFRNCSLTGDIRISSPILMNNYLIVIAYMIGLQTSVHHLTCETRIQYSIYKRPCAVGEALLASV